MPSTKNQEFYRVLTEKMEISPVIYPVIYDGLRNGMGVNEIKRLVEMYLKSLTDRYELLVEEIVKHPEDFGFPPFTSSNTNGK